MKKILKQITPILLLLFSVSLYGQINVAPPKDAISIDTLHKKIYNSSILKKGFYVNKDEFFNNAPSVFRNFIVQDITSTNKQREAGIKRVKYMIPSNESRITEKIWGFCDGVDVYVLEKGFISDDSFWKLDGLGPYPYYMYPLKSASSPIPIVGIIVHEALPSYEIFLMNKKGNFKRAYTDDFIELFEQAPDIKNAFLNELGPNIYESIPERSAITKKYLKMFNERLIEKE